MFVSEAKTKEQRKIELDKKSLSYKKSIMHMNLFVKGFNPATTQEAELKHFFSSFGPIKSLRVNDNGTAYVCYNDRETAKIALEQGRGMMLNGCYMTI